MNLYQRKNKFQQQLITLSNSLYEFVPEKSDKIGISLITDYSSK